MLIETLSNESSANVNVMAYADNFSAAENLKILRRWWGVMAEIGPTFGHYPKPTKTCLLVKSRASEKIESVFFRPKIKITTKGRRYLGRAVHTRKFKDNHDKS